LTSQFPEIQLQSQGSVTTHFAVTNDVLGTLSTSELIHQNILFKLCSEQKIAKK